MDDPLEDLLSRWRQDADVLRRRGAEARADLLDTAVSELQDALRERRRQELTIQEAAEWSGYSRERLRELVRDGKLPDLRPTGASRGTPFVFRREDLPRHPLGRRDPDAMPPRPGEADEGARPSDRALRRKTRDPRSG